MMGLYDTLSADKWKRIGAKRRAGVLAPLFTVYSRNSVGIGDLADLRMLIDWCEKTGNSILQLLPMNEIGSTSCPYDAISSFALEPMYISIEDVPAEGEVTKSSIRDLRNAFPTGKSHVNYAIKDAKIAVLHEIFSGGSFKDSKDFKKFVKDNDYWIKDFALFKILKDHHKGRPWYEWEDEYKKRDVEALEAVAKKYEKDTLFQKWMQWVAYSQFKGAKAYAGSKGVKICGDLPILISRDSADVWAHTDFFKLEFAAGAPPDMYCSKGQRWGMPTYNWKSITDDDYEYFKEKLKFAENFYDMLRVDHVVGLFRVWSIPYDDPPENEGLNGAFDPPEENVWEGHGKRILSMMLDSTDMLLCAEDLGMIPKACPAALKKFGIPGNDVQRWTKDWSVRHDFFEPKEYRFLAVAMLSTHDTTNWAAWWENEAGTVDESLFIRKASEPGRGIDYDAVKEKLFDPALSRHGRLRWLKTVSSTDILAGILGKRKEEIMDFIDMYENTYQEKEKLWKHLKMRGAMREKSDGDIVKRALQITQRSKAVFCVELLIDYLFPSGIFKGDPYKYRINRPGTVNKENWSLAIPIGLEDLMAHKVSKDIRAMIASCGRKGRC